LTYEEQIPQGKTGGKGRIYRGPATAQSDVVRGLSVFKLWDSSAFAQTEDLE